MLERNRARETKKYRSTKEENAKKYIKDNEVKTE